jgi:hypothetical protein
MLRCNLGATRPFDSFPDHRGRAAEGCPERCRPLAGFESKGRGGEADDPGQTFLHRRRNRMTYLIRGLDPARFRPLFALGEADAAIRTLFDRPEIAAIHAHNAAAGCFAARIVRD